MAVRQALLSPLPRLLRPRDVNFLCMLCGIG
jgi:hypothetical protein